MSRLTISGIEHIIGMINSNSSLASLSSLAPIADLGRKAKAAVARSGCSCSAAPVYAANRHVFTQALANIQHGDHLMIKNILKVTEICYYVKDKDGKNVLKCI